MQVLVNDFLVGYDRAGKGKTVLLLHGWGSNRSSMATLFKALSTSYDVISVDAPGFGESEPPLNAWSLSDFVEWINDFLVKINAKNLYALIGHSNGGAIAIKYAASGHKLGKLVLMGASGIRSREKGRKLLYKIVAKTGKTATTVLPMQVRKNIRTKWYKHIGSELYDRPGMEDTFKKVVSEDLMVDAAMISVPTLLIYGGLDQATPPSYGASYHQVIDGSKLEIVEGAGHYVFVDKPLITTTTVSEFLGK